MESGDNRKSRDDVDEETIEHHKAWIGIRCAEDDCEDENYLKRRGELAQNARREGPISRDQDNDSGNDQDENVAAEHEDGEPPGEFLFERKDDERRREKKFVGDGIEIGAKRRALIQAAGEQAVNAVRKSGEDLNEKRPFIVFVGNENKKERQKAEPEKRNLIGDCPDAAFHRT